MKDVRVVATTPDVFAWIKSIRDDVKTWIFLGTVTGLLCIRMFLLFIVMHKHMTVVVSLVRGGGK